MTGRFGHLIHELKRRKVIHSAGWYLGTAFVVMQVVEVVFPYLPLARPDAAGSLVLAILAIGFPVALALSWVFEISPPRLRRELPHEAEVAASRPTLDPVPARDLRPDSLAVLPFENLSGDPENAYFSDGITEDIITSVAHIRGLRVLSRTSVMRYRDAAHSVTEIAGELGVATVVRGSVRRSGSRVRIVAELIDAALEQHLWSETYDRDLDDIFEIQSDVAARIARAVQRELPQADRERIRARGTRDAEAYDLYLKARFLWDQRTEAAVNESILYFDRALERQPDFALAASGLADAYVVLGIYGARAPDQAFEAARRAAARSLSTDPSLGEAVATDACVRAVYDWDWAGAQQGFERAIALAPSYATAHQWFALNALTPQGRFDEARDQLEAAERLDPRSSAITVGRGIVSFYQRRHEEAAAEFGNVAALHPTFPLAPFFLGQCYGLLGQPDRGLELLRRAAELAGDSSETLAAVGHALAQAGGTEEAQAVLDRLRRRADTRYVSPALPAQVLIGLGRLDEAVQELENAASLRAADLIWLGVRPIYDPVRTYPDFLAVLDQVGLRRPTRALP